jgi:hypothetical protein
MSYCKKCSYLIEKVHEMAFGDWSHECKLLKIGREPDTYSCEKISLIEEKPDV